MCWGQRKFGVGYVVSCLIHSTPSTSSRYTIILGMLHSYHSLVKWTAMISHGVRTTDYGVHASTTPQGYLSSRPFTHDSRAT